MDTNKTQGNLRDFRIDEKPSAQSQQRTGARPTSPQHSHRSATASSLAASQTNQKTQKTPAQTIKGRGFSLPNAPHSIEAPSKSNSLKTPPTQPANKNVELPKSHANTGTLKTQSTSNYGNESRKSTWSLTDASLPAADEVNLWGHWEQDASLEIDLADRSQQKPRFTAAASEMTSIEIPVLDAEMQNSHSLQVAQAQTSSGIKETRRDIESQVQQEVQQLATESAGKQPWSVELALAERRAEKMGVVDYAGAFQKHEILRMRTREFTAKLHASFREQVELFNESRRSPAHAIQIYKVNNTAEDFMLFRNGVKLVISGQQAGRILFGFNQYMGQLFNANQVPTVELSAVWGPFEQLIWQYKAERVQVEDAVRYFFTEFVRQSFR